jgi:hypothetical protein
MGYRAVTMTVFMFSVLVRHWLVVMLVVVGSWGHTILPVKAYAEEIQI